MAVRPPLILYEQAPGVSAELIIVRPKLCRSLLRQAEQKVGKIEAGVAYRNATCRLRGVETGEDKASPGVAVSFSVELDPADVAAPPQSMLSVVPNHEVRHGVRLVAPQPRPYV